MYYLVDTNVFLEAIANEITPVASQCKENENALIITKAILDELEPGSDKVEVDEAVKYPFIEVKNLVYGTMGRKLIELVDITEYKEAEQTYKDLRKKFYSWMENAEYLHKLVLDGRCTAEEIKKSTFRNRDKGECELISLAKTSPENYVIVTEDLGRVYLHPNQNLFEDYAKDRKSVV